MPLNINQYNHNAKFTKQRKKNKKRLLNDPTIVGTSHSQMISKLG